MEEKKSKATNLSHITYSTFKDLEKGHMVAFDEDFNVLFIDCVLWKSNQNNLSALQRVLDAALEYYKDVIRPDDRGLLVSIVQMIDTGIFYPGPEGSQYRRSKIAFDYLNYFHYKDHQVYTFIIEDYMLKEENRSAGKTQFYDIGF